MSLFLGDIFGGQHFLLYNGYRRSHLVSPAAACKFSGIAVSVCLSACVTGSL